MTKYPQIGLENALQYLNDVVYPAYARFKQRQTRANALEVAGATWALHERLWRDKGCKPAKPQFRADLYRACPELELMRDYAEAGKHSGLSRDGVRLAEITGSENPGGTWEISSPLGQTTASPTCTLKMECINGRIYDVPHVLRRVVEFWSKELQKPVKQNTGANYEITVDDKPRTYRDVIAVAIESAQYLKRQNPNAAITLRDLQSGTVTVIEHPSALPSGR
jgi:hypothetical protein